MTQIGTNTNAITVLQQSFEGLVYGYSLTAAIDSSYKITVTLKDQSGNILSTTPAIDLPLETMVVGGSYDSTNKKIILTLDNGNTVDIPVGDLVSGLQTEITSSNKLSSDLVTDDNNSNKFVSATQKTKIDDSIDTAGSGLTVENGTGLHKSLKHTDSITAKTSVELLKIKFNSTGHITGVETATMSDMLMTGYTKSSSSDPLPIATTDTASEAIGKLEQQAGLDKSNISKNTDALVELLDSGAKNLLEGAEQQVSDTRSISFNISIPPGKYVIYVGEYASTDTDDTRAQAYFFNSNSDTVSTRFIQTKANGMYQEVTVSEQTARVAIYASDNASHGADDTVTVGKVMVCTKAAWDISQTYQPYRRPYEEIDNSEIEDRSALIELVDSGAKNRLTQSNFTGTAQVEIPIKIPAGTYVIYRSNLTSSDTDATACLCRLYDNSGGTNVQRASVGLARGDNRATTIEVSGDTTFMRIYASDTAAHSTGDTVTGTDFMVCTKTAWDISQKIQPYAMSNVELTEEVNPATYTSLTLSSSAIGKIDVKSGGYCKVGNLVIINAKIEVTTAIANNIYIFNTLPLPVAVSTGTSGYSVATVTATSMSSGISDTALALMLFNPTQPSGGTPTQGAIYTPGNHSGLPVGTYLLAGSYLAV